MSHQLKQSMEQELARRYRSAESVLVVDISRLSGIEANTLRGRLHAKGVEVHVVKNRLARRAFGDSALAVVGKSLSGPCALVTGTPPVVQIAKDLVELVKEYPALVLKGGLVEGVPEYLPFETISKMRSRLEVLGDVSGALGGPGRRIAACIRGPAGRIAGCVKALADRPEAGAAA